MIKPEDKLKELGLELPALRPAVGTYVSRVRTGNLIFTNGQGVDEYHGKLGRELSTEEGYLATQQTMLNLLSVIKDEMENLSKIWKFVNLLVMVNTLSV